MDSTFFPVVPPTNKQTNKQTKDKRPKEKKKREREKKKKKNLFSLAVSGAPKLD